MTNSAAMRVSRAGSVFGMQATDVTPAGHGRGGAGGDGLVLLAARFAQVDVHVDQARGRRSARCSRGFGRRSRAVRCRG